MAAATLARLPRLDHQQHYPPQILEAYDVLKDLYKRAAAVLHHEEADPIRVAFHIDAISSQAVNILEAMELEKGEDSEPIIPKPWIHETATLLGETVRQLYKAAKNFQGREDSNVEVPVFVEAVHTGKRGRPAKRINLDYLVEATKAQRNITKTELASLLGVHRNTLHLYMKKHGVAKIFSNLSNADLDILTKVFKTKSTESGLQYLISFLRNHGHRVQRRRVKASLRRVDNIGRVLRGHKTVQRRTYHVKRPDALWHCDGHHKMIRWGIVIHGFVDGFSRAVVGLRASTNNRAETVLDVFLKAVDEHGMPSRLRGDRGGENVLAAIYMVMRNGPNRASFMWGSSTRNTRIKRLWVEVGTQFVRRWRVFFHRLERLHHLDAQNPVHLWLLHTLFLQDINEDCDAFAESWNNHPIRTASNKSPNDMRFIGKTKFGIYRDDCEDLHPDTIRECYGVNGKTKRHEGETGAGHAADEHIDNDDIARRIAQDQRDQMKHKAVAVPRNSSPFSDSEEKEQVFFETLTRMIQERVIPAGYGILNGECQGGHYPDTKILEVGRR